MRAVLLAWKLAGSVEGLKEKKYTAWTLRVVSVGRRYSRLNPSMGRWATK